MADLSSVEIRLNGGKPACILDGALALSSIGLMLASRLAKHWHVWIVRSLWPLIDSDHVYRENPEFLDNSDDSRQVSHRNATAEALSDWHAAWISGRLNGSFYWVGDVRHESNLPPDLDDMFAQRFDVLASALLDKLDPADDDDISAYSWRQTCSYEAVALAAALFDRAAVIVTHRPDAQSDPPILGLLKRLHIRPTIVPSNRTGRTPLELPGMALVGMAPLLLDPSRLVAVHVCAPKALTLPWGPGGDEEWGKHGPDLARPFGLAPDPWEGASAAWHPLM